MNGDLRLRTLSKRGKLNPAEAEHAKKVEGTFEKAYQRWYTEACAVLKQLIPERLPEFTQLYHGDPKRKGITSVTYNIQDWLNGVRASKDALGEKYYNDFAIVAMRFNTQSEIL